MNQMVALKLGIDIKEQGCLSRQEHISQEMNYSLTGAEAKKADTLISENELTTILELVFVFSWRSLGA